MLESLRRLLRKGPKAVDLAPMKAWAYERGYEFRTIRDSDGCMVEPHTAHPAWRMEWGESQRTYIPGRELRIIGELGTPKELVVLVLSRDLMETMEKQVFEQYVEDVQTRLDTETPPEMRWLVLYSKLTPTELGRLRDDYAAVGSIKPWLQQWLSGPLNDALAATLAAAKRAPPMALTLSRGRLTLRTSMPEVSTDAMAMWLSVFEHAQREAKHLGQVWQSSAEASHSTQPAAWPKSTLPDDEHG
ncbi:hypothetical protein [Ideonella sp. A 288]|uniref:hypothetical protein n=1 Tax=Ideonella sp. A 288 TaxID=1962181 RepID=UPI001185021F|nr:hypothetical protein [Ideonella sp. A 288]